MRVGGLLVFGWLMVLETDHDKDPIKNVRRKADLFYVWHPGFSLV